VKWDREWEAGAKEREGIREKIEKEGARQV